MDDKQLVRQFLKNKSEGAFRLLYQAKTPHLYQMALRLTAYDEPLAEDLIQEMWCMAIRKLEQFEWRSELKTWLTGILINLARDRRKKNEREEVAQSILKNEVPISAEQPIFTTYDLENAIQELPAGYRQVIVLHDIEGYKHKEIAELLDISEGTSKSQLHHARMALRSTLNENTEKEQKS